jgi:hypothetical protein
MRTRLIGMLPAVAVALTEGAWVAVVYAALDVLLLRGHAAVGLWPFVLAAGLGAAITRVAGDQDARLGVFKLVTLLLLAFGAGVVLNTWLGGRPIERPTDLLNAGALMTMVAAWRGTAHWRPEDDDLSLSTLLSIGVPALSVPFIVAIAASQSQRQDFFAVAVPATLLFVAAGLAGIGFTRLAALGRETGTDWRTNRAWLALLASLLIGLLIVAAPAAMLVGAPLAAMFRWLIDPLRAALDAGDALLYGLAAAGGYQPPPAADRPVAIPVEPPVISIGAPAPFAILFAIAVVAFLVVLELVLIGHGGGAGRSAPPLGIDVEESGLELPHLSLPALRLPALRLRRRRRQPQTASEAYVAALAGLHGSTARSPAESPRSHARRVERQLGWRFEMLAADYELERYASLELSGPETRRALRRGAALHKRP